MSDNDFRDAFHTLKEEIRRDPSDDRPLLRLADVYARAGRTDRALRLLRPLVDHFAANGQPAKAVAALKRLQELDPTASGAYERVVALMHEDAAADHQELELALADEIDIGPIAHTHVHPAGHGDDVRAVEEQRMLEEAVPTPLFDDFTREDLLAFMRGLQLHVFDPGDIVVAQGDAGDSLFILTSGIVKAYVRDGGRFRHVRTMHDGDFFGEISVLSGGPRTATVTAATHCELLELDRTALDSMSAAHPGVRQVLQRYYDERIATV